MVKRTSSKSKQTAKLSTKTLKPVPTNSSTTITTTTTTHVSSWDEAVHLHTHPKLLDKLVLDCSTVFSARAAAASSNDSGGYSSGSTYWIARGSSPRCLLEQLACAILEAHLPPEQKKNEDNNSGAALVGAEWWTLSIDAQDDSVGFHWDLDYDTEERLHIHRTPYMGTVTYLCDAGAPTLVFDKSPTRNSRSGPPEDGMPIERGWISCPKAGKHLRFVGSCLHGAPDVDDIITIQKNEEVTIDSTSSSSNNFENEKASFRRKNKGSKTGASVAAAPSKTKGNKRSKRVSLLVNVWLDGAPGLASPLPEEIAKKLSPCLAKVPFSLTKPSRLFSPADVQDRHGKNGNSGSMTKEKRQIIKKKECSWAVANLAEDVNCSVCVQMPEDMEVPMGSNIGLEFQAGEAVLIF